MKKFIKKKILYFMLILTLFQAVPVYAWGIFSDILPLGGIKEEQNNIILPEKDKETEIVGEVTEKRELNSKTFLMSDGTMMYALYGDTIHYEENGKLLDVDNDLEEVVDKNGEKVLKNKKNDFIVEFLENSSSERLVSVQKDNNKLEWMLKGSSNSKAEKVKNKKTESIDKNQEGMTINNINSSLLYKQILNFTDLSYNLIGNRIKESIIVNSKAGIRNEYVFQLTTNLSAFINDDNSITFKNNDEIVYIMESPYMFDSNMVTSKDVRVILDKTEKGYELKILPDEDWLKDKSRVFPITIDPTILTKQVSSAIQDTIIYEGDQNNPPSNRMYAPFLRIGSNNLASLQTNPVRALMKFELPTLDSGDQVIGATLNLLGYPQHLYGYIYPTSQIQFNVHKMSANWTSSSAYWSNLWDKYESRVSDYSLYNYNTSNPSVWYQFYITSMVKEWYTTGNNYGLVIKEANEIKNLARSDAYFYSSDCGITSAIPAIVIQYRNQTGIEDYLSYETQDIGRAGTVYTNNYNGNLTLVHDDTVTPGNRLPVSIYHVYNTNDKDEDIGYGKGFRLNLSQTLETVTIGGVQYLKYIDENATRHYFYNDNNIWKDEDGLDLEITLSSNVYTMTDKAGNKSIFIQRWLKDRNVWSLSQITDINGNSINITFGNITNNNTIITTVTDGAGKVVEFYYENDLLSSIVNNVLTHYYYTNSNLTSIKYSDNKYSYYTYDNYSLLYHIRNVDNTVFMYDFYNTIPYRVKKITEYERTGTVGNYLNITYGENTTKIVDRKGFINTYSFDSYGRSISISSTSDDGKEAYGKSFSYGNSSNNQNKLTLETDLIKPVNNMILNGNFEETANWNFGQWGSTAGTCTYSTEDSFYGNKSMKCSVSSGTAYPLMSQELSLTKGKTYTISSWIKSTNTTSLNNAKIVMYYTASNGSLAVQELTKIDSIGDWNKYSITIDYPSNAISPLAIILGINGYINPNATVYFDGIQLEEGSISNPNNLLINPDFDNCSNNQAYWNADSSQINPTIDKVVQIENKGALKLNGEVAKNKQFSQFVAVKGNAGDSFLLNSIIKTTGLVNYGSRSGRISIAFTNSDGTYDWEDYSIDPSSNDWQYLSKAFIAKKSYVGITVYLRFFANANEIYFDYVGLYKDISSNSYTYDSKGNVISSSMDNKYNSTFEYNTKNELTKIVNPNGTKFDYTYDSNYKNRLIKAVNQNNISYNFTYDSFGNSTSLQEMSSDNTKYIETGVEYSNDGRYVTKVTDTLGNSSTSTYDTNKGTVTSTTDSKNNITNYTYDALDRLQTVNRNITTNSYTYGNTSNPDLLSTITHNGFNYDFTYDNFNNIQQIKLGNQTLITNNYEQYNGNLINNIYGNNNTISYSYDKFNRLSTKTNSLGTINYYYDNFDNLALLKDSYNNTVKQYTYDLDNRIVNYKENANYSINYKYDSKNNLSNLTYKLNSNSKVINYTYDTTNRLTNINNISYTYDVLNRLSNRKINNNYTTEYIYKDINQNKTSTQVSDIINGNETLSYTYDSIGNITSLKENNVLINEYEYDSLNELTVNNDYKNNKKYEYTYDQYGNILSKSEYVLSTNTLTSTINYQYNNINWKDQLTSYNGKSISYDTIGNPTSYDGYNYTWVNGRQLQSISNGTNTYSYKYNDSGIRTEKTVNSITTKYYLEGTDIIFEDRNGSIIYYNYDASGVSGFEYNNNTYYFVKNLQGDIIGILDSAFNRVVTYEYDSWGNITSIVDGQGNDVSNNANHIANINPFRYRSYYYDSETKLYYLNSRYYNPDMGRFINADGIIGANQDLLSYNLYAYVSNNPINFDDPSGEGIFDILNGVKDGFIGTFTGIANTVMHPIQTAKAIISNPFNTFKTAVLNTVDPFKTSQIAYNLIKGNDYDAGNLAGNNLGEAAVVGVSIYASKIKSRIIEVGRIKGVRAQPGYIGVRYENSLGQIKSIEIHPSHGGHGIHLQSNTWWLNKKGYVGQYYRGQSSHFEILKPWKGWD